MMSQDEVSEQADAVQITQWPILNITLLASEWKSSAGGLSTLNRELAIHLAQIENARVSLLVPEGACNDEDKREARSFGISILDAKKCVGVEPLLWLSNPPQDHNIDVIVGHGVKLGCQVQLIKRHPNFENCKWVHVVHTAPEDLSKYKDYSNPISRGEEKHWDEVDLCKCADLVVPVGPRLGKAYHSYLQECKKDEDFFELIPGLFEREFGDLPANQKPKDESDNFIVLLCGRGDEEDFELKGYNIAVKAFADQRLKGKHYSLLFVGSPEGKQDEVRERLLKYGITNEQLTVREFVKSRERMKELFCEVDMAIMPSKSEGFGLFALEALSAGLPILVGSNSGFARAIKNIPYGKYSIVGDSGNPGKWAEAIEDVRDRHGLVLRENKMLIEHYSEEYCWKKQCGELVDRLWKMVYAGTCTAPTEAAADKVEQRPSAGPESVCQTDPKTMQLHIEEPAVTSARGKGMNTNDVVKIHRSEQMQLPSAVSSEIPHDSHSVGQSKTNDDEIALATYKNKQHLRELGGNLVKLLITAPVLEGEKQRIVYEMLASQVQTFAECLDHSTDKQKGVGAMTESIIRTYGLLLENVGMGSLIITFNCQSLKSLEHLWSDYLSGHLDKMAEQYLVTNEMKEKLNMETIGLKTTIERENYLRCRRVLMECSGTSAAQAIAGEDSIKQQSPVILQAVCRPDRTLQQQFKEGVSTLGNKSPKKLGKRGISESSAEHDVDTHEIAKVQRLEEQLQRVTPEAFYKPGSVLKLEVNEEEKVLATCEVEQHLRDFREPSSSQTTAADDWLEQSPLAIPKAVGQLHPTPLSQHIGEGSVCAGSKDAEKLGKRRYSESSAGHGIETRVIAKMLRSEEQLPSVSSEKFYEPHFSCTRVKVMKRRKLWQHLETVHREGLKEKVTELHHLLNKVFLIRELASLRWPQLQAMRKYRHQEVLFTGPQSMDDMRKSKSAVDVKDQFSLTPLHLACWYGQESVVKLLLEHGADVNATDEFQFTPLHKAERHNHHSIVKLLLDHN
ncbi:PREDICTED: uncharacterized protein LOC107344434 [Acropora digitifera]|uniref:uncharacterized protein LOC107344434 n=1 Tax=Acropora digitifera TaxID=70779 RepID=UPI00077ABEC5|nr:PREDICTED: uncharacterized protein LOC107344434 [Acropora digitifera]